MTFHIIASSLVNWHKGVPTFIDCVCVVNWKKKNARGGCSYSKLTYALVLDGAMMLLFSFVMCGRCAAVAVVFRVHGGNTRDRSHAGLIGSPERREARRGDDENRARIPWPYSRRNEKKKRKYCI